MLWGAIAGTLPDLDVFANLVTDPVSALAYHRAFTHSLVFATLVPVGMGMLVHRLYGGREGPLPRSFAGSWLATWLFFVSITFLGSWLMPLEIHGVFPVALTVSTVALALVLPIYARERWRTTPTTNENPHWWGWTQLFFWAILTHPLLDACTTYGTQLFEPFSSLRVAWNVISVADPLYTAPFLFCLVVASRKLRGSDSRRRWNRAGILISSAYLLLSTAFHAYANSRMVATLEKENIAATRHMIGPTILNSILWQGAAETDSAYYTGQYSLLDSEPYFKLREVPKQHELIRGHFDDRDVRLLRWFANDYFSIEREDSTSYRLNDLRFGQIEVPGQERPSYVFYFVLEEHNGELRARRIQQGPEDREMSMQRLWDRMMGRY
jgi:inner membrane protein